MCKYLYLLGMVSRGQKIMKRWNAWIGTMFCLTQPPEVRKIMLAECAIWALPSKLFFLAIVRGAYC